MKFISTYKDFLNEQQMFEEIKISEYRIEKRNNGFIGYFKANDLKYSVEVYHNDNKHDFGVWEVEFSVVNQAHAGHRTKKDIQHLNTVLHTVFEIVQKIVKENNIKTIYIDSANDENDENRFNTVRAEVYYRFLKNKFGEENIDKNGRFIYVYFSNEEGGTKLEKIKNILIDISDNYLDIDSINRGINGVDDDNFVINTDSISNKNVGDIYFEIEVSENHKEYSLSYEFLETEESESFDCESFEELMNHLEKIKTELVS
jgi:hypothetical protein